MAPARQAWFQKASVQAAIVGGIFAVLGAATGAVFARRTVEGQPTIILAGVVPPPAPERVKHVESISEPTARGLRILTDFRIVDMRSGTVVQETVAERRSPVTVTRYMTVEKGGEESLLEFEFATLGLDVSARCITHDYELFRSMSAHYHGTSKMNVAYKMSVPLNEPSAQPVLVVTEATYWNNLHADDERWAMVALSDVETNAIAMALLFPPRVPYTDFEVWHGPHGQQADFTLYQGDLALRRSPEHDYLYWELQNPKPGYAYEVRWKWSMTPAKAS